MKIKICGITRLEDGLAAVEAGADLLGFNFYPKSPRYIRPKVCRDIVEQIRARLTGERQVTLVGVFVNANPRSCLKIVDECGLDLVQCSGDEPPQTLKELGERGFKALRPRSAQELTSILSKYPRRLGEPAWLIDAYQAGVYGGTGIRVDVDSFKMSLSSLGPFLLAGGLTPENVARVVEQVRPWGVDVASGVETAPGEKSFDKMRAFVRAAHGSAEEEFYNAASN